MKSLGEGGAPISLIQNNYSSTFSDVAESRRIACLVGLVQVEGGGGVV